MNHFKAIGIKFIVVAIVIFSLFSIFTNASLSNLLWMAIILTGVSYYIGDIVLLRRFGNLTTTFMDFGLVFLMTWVVANLLLSPSPAMTLVSFYCAFILTFTEALFHGYMQEKVFSTEEELPSANQLQMEFAEEIHTESITTENKEKREE